MQNIQAIDVPLLLSEDGGATWKELVCVDSYDSPLDAQTTETNTFCGIAIGVGPIKFGPKGSAVCEANPDNATQVTLNKMLQWLVSREVIMFKMEYPSSGGSAGINFYIAGTCMVTSIDNKVTVGDVVKFDFTLLGTGEPDINA